ncbi:dimethylarginine dimethylaminohydrolase family protein [Alteribacter natronophilus]|uniref:dimethylarginine dimethylaminohydrolase family protein n=1 Tax=Alteribacter natronophilus TaxID=2583810 RepID=UPI003F66D38E
MNKTDQIMQSFCDSEFGKLIRVAVCEPEHIEIRDPINETQKQYTKEGIDTEKAMYQHGEFCRVMEDNGVEVIRLSPLQEHPEQVFTRDIAFTLGKTIFVAEMAAQVRIGEEDHLKDWLKKEKISYYNILGDTIEGGDIIVDGSNIYAGISDRTNRASVEHLESLLPSHSVVPIAFPHKYLHLDCIFNILSPEHAILFKGVMDEFDEELLTSRYDCIEVSEEEQFTLGTNVLSLGNGTVISLPVNKDVNRKMRDKGYQVIEVDISEIIKSGGSFRCCSMPILRQRSY